MVVNPRIYRTFLGLAAFAVIVFGFSFQGQPGALTTTLAPPSFAGVSGPARNPGTMQWLADHFPNRPPGSAGDNALAAYVAGQFAAIGSDHQFSVSRTRFSAQTADGPRTLTNVVATRTGIAPGTIVVVASRDSPRAPGLASLSGTAVLLELARVLAGETQQRSLMLVSTSGTIGASGAKQLAGSLAGKQDDAVIVLGDLAGARVTEPLIVPWSDAAVVAPPLLRNTLAAAVSAQAGLTSGSSGIVAQFAHLAIPLTTTEQGPFGTYDIPAVLLSVSGNRAPAGNEPTDADSVAGSGQAVLEAVDALNGGPAVPAPSAYLIVGGKIVPAWAVRLLVLALIAPVLFTMIDALARVRRRGHSVIRWVLWVLAGAVPFVLAFALIALASLTGWLDATPPGPVGAGGVRLEIGRNRAARGAGAGDRGLIPAAAPAARPSGGRDRRPRRRHLAAGRCVGSLDDRDVDHGDARSGSATRSRRCWWSRP